MADHARDLVRKDKQKNSTQSGKGKNYLFAIAIDDYQYCSKLNNAVYDVEAFIGLMGKRFDFDTENILFIQNKEATKRRIETEFLRLIKKTTPEDNLVVYFSGHGRYDEHYGGNWVPVDAGTDEEDWADYLSNDQVKSYLGKIKSKHTFLIADSCFSGSLFIDKSKEKIAGERRDTEPSRWGLTSGKKEIVSDGRPGQHSPFASALLDVYSKAEQPPSVMGICELVLEKVMANAQQTPMGSPLTIPGHQGGQMVFYFREDEEAVWQELKDTAEGCNTYLNRFPDGKYRALAKSVISVDQQRKAWDAALAAKTKAALYRFEREYPDSEAIRSGLFDRKLGALEEEELWKVACTSDTVWAYRQYLRRSNLKKYDLKANEAIHKILEQEELQEWQNVKVQNTVLAYQKYLRDHPAGAHVQEAVAALAKLEDLLRPVPRKIRVELRDEENRALRLPYSFSINNLVIHSSTFTYEVQDNDKELLIKVEKHGYISLSKKYALDDEALMSGHLVIQLEKRKEASIKVLDENYTLIPKASVRVRWNGAPQWTLVEPTDKNGKTLLKGFYVDEDISVVIEHDGFERKEVQFLAIEEKLILITKKKTPQPKDRPKLGGYVLHNAPEAKNTDDPKEIEKKTDAASNGGGAGLANSFKEKIRKYKLDYKKVAIVAVVTVALFGVIALVLFFLNSQDQKEELERIKLGLTQSLNDKHSNFESTFEDFCRKKLDTSTLKAEYDSNFRQMTIRLDSIEAAVENKKSTFAQRIDTIVLKTAVADSSSIANEMKNYYDLLSLEYIKNDNIIDVFLVSIKNRLIAKELEPQHEAERKKFRTRATTMCDNSTKIANSYARIVRNNNMQFSATERVQLEYKFNLIAQVLQAEFILRTSPSYKDKNRFFQELKDLESRHQWSNEQRAWLDKVIKGH